MKLLCFLSVLILPYRILAANPDSSSTIPKNNSDFLPNKYALTIGITPGYDYVIVTKPKFPSGMFFNAYIGVKFPNNMNLLFDMGISEYLPLQEYIDPIFPHRSIVMEMRGFRFKHNLFAKKRFQPYYILGINNPSLIDVPVHNGEQGVWGWALDLGTGFEYFINRSFSVGLESVMLHCSNYNSLLKYGEFIDINEGFKGTYLLLSIGLRCYLF